MHGLRTGAFTGSTPTLDDLDPPWRLLLSRTTRSQPLVLAVHGRQINSYIDTRRCIPSYEECRAKVPSRLRMCHSVWASTLIINWDKTPEWVDAASDADAVPSASTPQSRGARY